MDATYTGSSKKSLLVVGQTTGLVLVGQDFPQSISFYMIKSGHGHGTQQGPGLEEQDIGLILLNVYGANPLECPADFNGSGAIDGSDIVILANNPGLLDLSEFAAKFGRFCPDLIIFENP